MGQCEEWLLARSDREGWWAPGLRDAPLRGGGTCANSGFVGSFGLFLHFLPIIQAERGHTCMFVCALVRVKLSARLAAECGSFKSAGRDGKHLSTCTLDTRSPVKDEGLM